MFGIDVSHYQGTVSWGAARAAGVEFAFAKATEGTGFVDGRLARNLAGMRSAGVLPGAYHFLRPGDGRRQADAFARAVGGVGAGLLVALDVEASGIAWSTVKAWRDRWAELHPGHPVFVYTGRDLWGRVTGDPADGGASLGPLWAAGRVPNAYGDSAGDGLARSWARWRSSVAHAPFGGWQRPLIVQWTENARVPGVPTPCDGDHTDLTVDELAVWARPSSTTGPGHAPGGTTTHPEADVPLTQTEIDAIATATARAVHSQQLYRQTDPDGTPLTIGEAILRTYQQANPAALAAAVVAALPAGSVSLTEADVEAALRRVLVDGVG